MEMLGFPILRADSNLARGKAEAMGTFTLMPGQGYCMCTTNIALLNEACVVENNRAIFTRRWHLVNFWPANKCCILFPQKALIECVEVKNPKMMS